MNTDELEYALIGAERRVLEIQAKLHQWATDGPGRRFDDLFNLVADPAFLVVAWDRVRGNRGARTAGVDGVKPRSIVFGRVAFLSRLREDLKAGQFRPLPVREKLIPKKGGKLRGLGIPTARDRTLQGALKLVLEPIFEADFKLCSHGFRPGHRAQDAIAEIHHFTSRSYEWVVEGDIKACFDEISHTGLMGRLRGRIGDKRVLALIKAFLKAGVLSEDGVERDTVTGTPQGGVLSPLLSNVALSVLDEHFVGAWEQAMNKPWRREARRRKGLANYRLTRYADDWVLMVAGDRADAERLREEAAMVLSTMGLRLSEEKTRITHIDEGFDFLGMHIQRHKKRGAQKRHVYTYPTRAALASVKAKVKATASYRTTNQTLPVLIRRLNPVLRGWVNYHRHGASSKAFAYLSAYTWRRVWLWLRRKHRKVNTKDLRRRYLNGWWPEQEGAVLFNPQAVAIVRYRWRASIETPWATMTSVTA